MKKLDSAKLDSLLYVDSKNVAKDTAGVDFTLKNYFLHLINDAPSKTPFTRSRLEKIEAINSALSRENVVLEDDQLKFLSTTIDEIGILNKKVYAQIVDCLDSATEFKP